MADTKELLGAIQQAEEQRRTALSDIGHGNLDIANRLLDLARRARGLDGIVSSSSATATAKSSGLPAWAKMLGVAALAASGVGGGIGLAALLGLGGSKTVVNEQADSSLLQDLEDQGLHVFPNGE